jgi:hypothetical protein
VGGAVAVLLVACAPSAGGGRRDSSPAHAPEPVAARTGADRAVITSTDSYWTSLTGSFTIETGSANHSDSGLFVISGTLRNVSARPIRRVWLHFELLDAAGQPVYAEQGVNGLAEPTIDLSDAELARTTAAAQATLAAGATDSYRMILLGNEIPDFDQVRVTIVSTQ